MAESILRLKVESQEYDNKLKRAAEGLTRYAEQCRKAGGTLQYVDEGVLEFTRSLGKMDTVATTTRGKLAELTKTYTELSAQYRKMTDEEKQGEYGKALAASLDQLRGRIQSSKQELDEINQSINGGGGLTSSLDALAGKFGLSIKQLTGWGAAIAAAKGALDVAKDAFFQSESNIDEWGRTLEGAKGAYNVFLDTLNNGNWSDFFKNLETAIKGGRDLYDALDRLGSIKSNNAAAIAIVQQQIAQLRLAKQQGKDVDDQLKAATARLAALQKQSIQAGKAAGNQTAFNVIRNGVNSIGGARVNDATIKLAVSQLMTSGQAQFDKFRNNRDILRQRGMVTRTQTIVDSQGGTYQRQYKEFDINALSREQQKQYALAQAITEGETRIQKGISAFAQAVSEGTASAREEFRGNRYALLGSRGGGGGGGGGTTTPVPVEIESFDFNKSALAATKGVDTMPSVFGMLKDSGAVGINGAMGSISPDLSADIEKQTALVDELREKWAKAGGELRDSYITQIIEAEDKLRNLKDEQEVSTSNTPQFDAKQDISKQWKVGKNGQLTRGGGNNKEKDNLGDFSKNFDQITNSVSGIFNGIEQLGIELPQGLKDVLGGIQVVAGILTAISSLVTIITAIQGTKSVPIIGTFLAGGGMIKAFSGTLVGNTYSGDQLRGIDQSGQLYGLNAGEVVLNRAQVGNLASQLQGAGMQSMQLSAIITGEQLRLVLNNNGRRTGRGEYITTNFR